MKETLDVLTPRTIDGMKRKDVKVALERVELVLDSFMVTSNRFGGWWTPKQEAHLYRTQVLLEWRLREL